MPLIAFYNLYNIAIQTTDDVAEKSDSQDYASIEEKNDDNNQDLVIEDEDQIIQGDMKEEIKNSNKSLLN